jgi:hypothetical protein
MHLRRRMLARSLAAGLVLLLGAFVFALREGLVPVRWSPLPAIDLAEPNAWFLDWRLSELKRDAQLCTRVLQPPWIDASALADAELKDGCGWRNGVRVTNAGGTRLRVEPITCELAAALALWLAHEVQPRAEALLGAKVSSVQHFGGYSCRNIKGNATWAGVRSQHARANALDISGFTLRNGRQVSVAKHWTGDSPEARFLHEIHARACHYFRVAVGPRYNPAHRTHFHYDRGGWSVCK